MKKHFRKIPDYISRELEKIQSRYVVVASVIDTTKDEISLGIFQEIGLQLCDGKIIVPQTLTPEKMTGLYARYNKDGKIWVQKDLPKVRKTFWWESPNFGGYLNGYHSCSRTALVYQRRLEPPRDWEIGLSILSEDDVAIRIKAELLTYLDRYSTSFEEDLFFGVNLMQEQFRSCHVFDSTIREEDFAKLTIVGWEIFPPGSMERTLSVLTNRLRSLSPAREKEIKNRADVLSKLNPTEHIIGRGMNSRYFGAKFGDNVIVFENMDYGNALYILFDNWKEISQMSRIDILRRHEKDYIRILHKKGWEKRLEHYINTFKTKKNGN